MNCFVKWWVVGSVLLLLTACGGGSGTSSSTGTTGSTTTTTTTVGPAANLALSSSVAASTAISQGGQATISALVTDANGQNVADGTTVTFSATAGTIAGSATTSNGVATAIFTAGNSGGFVTITATTNSISKDISLQVAGGNASTITFVSANPSTVGIKSGGQAESTTLTFQVLDSGGGAVADGTPVDFAIATPLGGGESVSPNQNFTTSGLVTVTMLSGSVSGTVSVTASVASTTGTTVSTLGRVIITAGLPDSSHFSLATTKYNLPGYSISGETATITAFVADRYSNPVPINTPVFFESEAGAMGLTQVFTNADGQASATHITQAPWPNTISTVTGQPGLTRIIAWTAGQEAYSDRNGNGQYDAGEPFDDIGEPFIDANDNGVYDMSANVANDERYKDLNNNGQYDGPNGVWDADTFIWDSINLLWSSASPSDIVLNVTPAANCPNFVIPSGQGCDITITASDLQSNPVVSGSKLSVRTAVSGGNFGINPSSFDIPDALKPGQGTTEFVFTITNNATFGPLPVTVDLDIPDLANVAGFTKSITFTATIQ